MGDPLWTPGAERRRGARLAEFARAARAAGAPEAVGAGGELDYAALHAWSVAEPGRFWTAVWDHCGIVGDRGAAPSTGLDRMDPADRPRWFPEARLNYAENLLQAPSDLPALVSWDEGGRRRVLGYGELRREVARLAAGLRAAGVGPGDRVAGFLPNLPETVVGLLAAAAIGAVWSSCSPDFGTGAVVDRFGQIGPRVLIAADGYRYMGKRIHCLPRVAEIAARLPSVERVVIVPNLEASPALDGIPSAVLWEDFCAETGAPEFVRLPFDHPLAILYSSGTTGLPKCIVHGAGGTLLQHRKELALHTDLRAGERIFYYTTCGWMMWNWLVSALGMGATVVLYDGAPMAPAPARGAGAPSDRPDILWELAAREEVNVFGTSAKYLALMEKEGVRPRESHDLSALRAVLSTGSPLAGHSYDYVYRHVRPDVHLASISGGTDIVSCFVLGVPTAPVRRGEIQGAGLGMAMEIRSPAGERLVGEPGELVCTRPFPSMPLGFWDDPGAERYRAAYFARFPGVWHHGDWAEETVHGGYVIYGRSDATLNPGGVRIGTAEIYRQVERLPEVVEAVAVGQEIGEGVSGDVRIVLFVRLRPGIELDEALRERIRGTIRENTSPFHIPRVIVQVGDLPRTVNGKLSEIAVRETIHGRPVRNVDALANPESLVLFREVAELRV